MLFTMSLAISRGLFFKIFDSENAMLQEKSPYSFRGGSEISKSILLFSFKL